MAGDVASRGVYLTHRIRKLLHRLEASLWVLGERTFEQRGEARDLVGLGNEAAGGAGFLEEMLVEQDFYRAAIKGFAPLEHMIGEAPEAVGIRTNIGRVAAELFWAHVGGAAQQVALHRTIRKFLTCESAFG